MKLLNLFIALFVLPFPNGKAAENGISEVPEVLVTPGGKQLNSRRSYTTDKIEVMKKDRIESTSSRSLNEAIDRMTGVDSQDYCVNCGAKRISINGLRGDHTSVLIDGIPLYSPISSVYGYDAIPMQSVEEIEVMRGTGGALINPEAIGGAINIITLTPQETGSRASLFLGGHGTRNYELLHNHVFENYKVSVGGEFNNQEAWDVDHNGFAESPFKSRYSFFLKQIFNLSSKTQWATRFSFADMEIIGGNTSRYKLKEPISIQASDTDFDVGDVRKRYLGDISQISEYIGVKRSEGTSKITSILDEDNSLAWNLGAAIYEQTSLYMHAFDYSTKDTTLYTDVRWIHQLSENQMTTLGLSYRYEILRSQSKVMYDKNRIPKDNFNYTAYSLFGQHDWSLGDGLEVSTALRSENLESKWLEINSVNRNVISPRILMKWQHNQNLSQQLAYGEGYRMPLTSIESVHGAYDGFIVDIKKLETSKSAVYSLSYNTPKYYFTPGIHYTRLENMSYALEPEVAHSGPLRFVNDSKSHDIYVYDILVGVKPDSNWLLELAYENFRYPDAYKNKLPTAAIEERVNLRSEVEMGSYEFIVNGSWIGDRNIAKYYQYSDHYNTSDGLLGASDQKLQKAPSFWQWDMSLSKNIKMMDLTLGVQNLFDYTQTKKGDSPAMWHLHGDHTHLDNRHVWGPNRGREYHIKMIYNF